MTDRSSAFTAGSDLDEIARFAFETPSERAALRRADARRRRGRRSLREVVMALRPVPAVPRRA